MSHGEIEASAANALVGQGLLSVDELVQRQAIDLVRAYPQRFLTPTGIAIPWSLLERLEHLCPYVTQWVSVAVAGVIAARPRAQWREKRAEFNYAVAIIAHAYQIEIQADYKADSGAILKVLIDAFDVVTLSLPQGAIDLGELAKEVAQTKAAHSDAQRLVDHLRTWASLRQPKKKVVAKRRPFALS